MFVHDVMTARPTAATPGMSVKEALVLLDRHRITSLPVVDGAGHVLGVVSEADLIRERIDPDARAHILGGQTFDDRPATVEDVMTRHPMTVHRQTDLAEAVDLMTSTSVKSLPVVDDHDRLVGIISRSDVVRVLARSDDALEAEVDELLRSLGHDEWLVEVTDGVVLVSGPATERDRTLAHTAAGSVSGVVHVRVR